MMRTPEEIFTDFKARRRGVLNALTTDVEEFHRQADPDRENLCLYGTNDGNWVVDLPAEEVPPEVPEPALGINFARDGMQRRDWLALVAVHSDTWLVSVAFYYGARLHREGREKLFELINELPTCYEVVSGKAREAGKQTPVSRKRPSAPPGPSRFSQHPRTSMPRTQNSSRPSMRQGDSSLSATDEEADDEDDAGGGYADGEGDPCPNCGRVYKTGDFWIQCDFCDTWYDGKCVQMTPNKAQRMGKWKCPACLRRSGGA
ncbi:hypothetical protein WJX84_003338 [Apatococcus fuscideae]|uniref:PHD-type domain-containing protein n=1 Tax=Apatococcus fuscideae TaxID=2026836 RepID=A0AAW1TF82_9CHLO